MLLVLMNQHFNCLGFVVGFWCFGFFLIVQGFFLVYFVLFFLLLLYQNTSTSDLRALPQDKFRK